MSKSLVALTFFAIFLLVEGDGSDKSTEDCQAFNTLGDKIEALAKSYKLADSCTTFSNCSGIKCTGGIFGRSFRVSVGMEHCEKPVRLWMHLSVQSMNIDEWRELKDGIRTDIFKDKTLPAILPVTASAYVIPNFERTGNNITLSGDMCVSSALLGSKCQTIPKVSLPVSRAMCDQKGGVVTPTVRTPKPVTRQSSNTTATKAPKPAEHSTKKLDALSRSSTEQITTFSKGNTKKEQSSYPTKVLQSSTPKKSHAKVHGRKHSSGASGISTGTKVAIVSSVILAILLLIGLFAYWRKLKKKRPAYYNDITINAGDEEPFMDSHLVL
ncbi:uncharacterized protein LOC135684612 [Rhopilema esculentum]|uniref:uncharacterized protein LOC135684612 n=1 Tax=Rhopilema esculentum TaxID=499914 RepID=UPI0031D4B651